MLTEPSLTSLGLSMPELGICSATGERCTALLTIQTTKVEIHESNNSELAQEFIEAKEDHTQRLISDAERLCDASKCGIIALASSHVLLGIAGDRAVEEMSVRHPGENIIFKRHMGIQ
jgi:hypothetical protein